MSVEGNAHLENLNENSQENLDQAKDTVKYDTYSRVLGKLKKTEAEREEMRSKIQAYEQKERELEEKRLTEQGEYKKLLELERKKRIEEESKRTQYEKDLLDAHKLNALKEKLPGKVKRNEYYNFVDLDKIVIDPSTGHIDETSLQEVADHFVNEHGSLIERKGSVGLPQNAARDGMQTLSYEQWLTLPLKEQKARRKEVMENWKKTRI